MIEKVLYGIRKGQPDYMADIITTNEKRFDEAKAWAIENGFDRFRIAEIDLSVKPDFTKCLN